MKNLLKVPYYALVGLVFMTGLLLLATLAPIPGNFSVKIVKSGSMEPTIKTGGIVVIRPTSQYGVGDVITFGKDTKTQIPTTHRIVEEKIENGQTLFTTKGDANDSVDPAPIKKSDIRGRVLFTLPYVGFILDFAKKPLGFVLIVGIPALLVIIDEIGNIWREFRKLRPKKQTGGSGNSGAKSDSIALRKDESFRSNNVLDLRIRHGIMPQKRYAAQILALIAILGGLLSISSVGSTFSYYRQDEVSKSNMLQASAVYPGDEIESLVFEIKSEDTVAPKEVTITEVLDETSTPTDPVVEEDVIEGEITPPDLLLQADSAGASPDKQEGGPEADFSQSSSEPEEEEKQEQEDVEKTEVVEKENIESEQAETKEVQEPAPEPPVTEETSS